MIVYETLISKWGCLYFYISHSEVRHILEKSLKIGKMARPVDPNCRNTA